MSSKFKLLKQKSGLYNSTKSNVNGIYADDELIEEEAFDKQDFMIGSGAKQRFWELYKSERKFKDFEPGTHVTADPRFAYFQTCTDLKIRPKAGLLIKDQENPIIDFSN
jgi:hypothetical protein